MLIREFKKYKEFDLIVCSTGQHREMLDQILDAFSITPDIDMHIMKERQTLSGLSSRIMLHV